MNEMVSLFTVNARQTAQLSITIRACFQFVNDLMDVVLCVQCQQEESLSWQDVFYLGTTSGCRIIGHQWSNTFPKNSMMS